MGTPFFSVLLPTKNRSEIVGGAIQSVLDQTFHDFEIVVSDNDDSADLTRDAVAAFGDARIKYIRTAGNLSMHDNWDNAFAHSAGQYVIVLEDKMRLVANALEIVRASIKDEKVPVTFLATSAPGQVLPPARDNPRTHRLDSVAIINDFARFRPAAFHRIPKGFDCCVSRRVLADLKAASPTGFLFSYICPDYSFGFMLLSVVDSVVRIETPLIYIPNNWMWSGNYSNGQSSYRKDALIRRFLKDLPIDTGEITARVPIKVEFLWINMVLYDFFTKYRRPGHEAAISWADYHAFVFTLILLGKKMGADMSEEGTAFRASLRKNSFPFRIQVAFKIGIHLFLAAKQAAAGRLARSIKRPASTR